MGDFPASFICNLPRTNLRNSSFSEHFPNPVTTAIELLRAAKEEYFENDILREIDNRLDSLRGASVIEDLRRHKLNGHKTNHC
jgi:hypothetical protein